MQDSLQQSYMIDNYAGGPYDDQSAANAGSYNIMPTIYNSLKDSYNYMTGAEGDNNQ